MEEKPSLRNVRGITFPVQDIEKTAKFYTNVFDLQTKIIEEKEGIITSILLFRDFERFRLRLDKIKQKPIFERELWRSKIDLRINTEDLSRGFNLRIIENIQKNNGRIILLGHGELVFEDIDGKIIEISG